MKEVSLRNLSEQGRDKDSTEMQNGRRGAQRMINAELRQE